MKNIINQKLKKIVKALLRNIYLLIIINYNENSKIHRMVWENNEIIIKYSYMIIN